MRIAAIMFIILMQIITTTYIIKNTDDQFFAALFLTIVIVYIAYIATKKIIPTKEIVECFKKFDMQIQKTMEDTKRLGHNLQEHNERFASFKKRLADLGLNGDDEVPSKYVKEYEEFENEMKKLQKFQEDLHRRTFILEAASHYYKDGIAKTIFKSMLSHSWQIKCPIQ